ncbi:hypothetical protein [Belnapia rosea]|nr:hypothetical protein [Belnapia rosea]
MRSRPHPADRPMNEVDFSDRTIEARETAEEVVVTKEERSARRW